MIRTGGRSWGAWVAVLAAASGLAGGCSSAGGFGESVRFSASAQTPIDEVLSRGERLVIPKNMPFAITDAQRQSEGSGASESSAGGDGKAQCRASVEDVGTASAGFQLGHLIFNGEDQPLEVAVTVDCAFAYGTGGNRSDTFAPETIGLKFYVKDSNRSVLRKQMLVAPEGVLGATAYNGRERATFEVTLQPQLAYQFILAGHVEVRAKEQPEPLAAHIEVSQCEITVAAR
jgi:hypothetical protein